LCAAALLAASGGLPAAEPASSALDQLSTPDKSECALTGRAFLQIADLRQTGANPSMTIDSVTRSMDERGRTGSHLRGKSHRESVARFTQFAYAHKDMKRESLFVHGLYGCALAKLASDDAAFDRGQQELDPAVMGCQEQFPGKTQLKELGDCVQREANQIVMRATGKLAAK
jgi:hypothetical protein